MADGALRVYLDISEIDQQKVLSGILSMDGQALECDLASTGSLGKIKKMRQRADITIGDLAIQREVTKDAMKSIIFEKLFNGRTRLRQLSEQELSQLIDSTELAIKGG